MSSFSVSSFTSLQDQRAAFRSIVLGDFFVSLMSVSIFIWGDIGTIYALSVTVIFLTVFSLRFRGRVLG